jgi:peroxiredoxin
MLRVGDRAPDFSLPDADMQLRSRSDFAGRHLVLYFYPKDDTPACTLQATDFSELAEAFEAEAAQVVGVSADDCFTHQAFRDRYGLKLILLADVDGEACKAYGVLQEREKNGLRRATLVRSTFIIDRSGTVRHVEYGVAPKGHAKHILDLLREIRRAAQE